MQVSQCNQFRIPQITEVKDSENTCRMVSVIASRVFFQMSAALTINFAVMTFIAAPLSITLMSGILLTTATIGILHAAYEIYRKKNLLSNLQKNSQIVSTITQASIVNVAGLSGPNIAIHESGHALAALTLFRDPSPEVKIFPFMGGATSYHISNGLTKFGKFFGKNHALMIVTAAGMAASTLFALFEFAIADRIKEAYPLISQFMTHHAIFQLFNEIVYALTAFISNKMELSHDFICLWQKGGIHPLIPIAFMIALPLLEYAIIKYLNSQKSAQKIENLISIT